MVGFAFALRKQATQGSTALSCALKGKGSRFGVPVPHEGQEPPAEEDSKPDAAPPE